MELTLPELNTTNLFYVWLVVHVVYGLATHYRWLAKTKDFARRTNDVICLKASIVLFIGRMALGLELAALYYVAKIMLSLVTFTNAKPWSREIDVRNCVQKTCNCCKGG